MNTPGSRLDIPGGPAWRKGVEQELAVLRQSVEDLSIRLDSLRQVVRSHNNRIAQLQEQLRQLEQQPPS